MIDVQNRSEGRVEVVQLDHRLDAENAPGVRQHLTSLMDQGRKHLAIDLAHVSFVDSSGLSVFVHAVKTARAAGGDVVLIQPTPAVRSILELTRLNRVLEVMDDEPAAMMALAPAS